MNLLIEMQDAYEGSVDCDKSKVSFKEWLKLTADDPRHPMGEGARLLLSVSGKKEPLVTMPGNHRTFELKFRFGTPRNPYIDIRVYFSFNQVFAEELPPLESYMARNISEFIEKSKTFGLKHLEDKKYNEARYTIRVSGGRVLMERHVFFERNEKTYVFDYELLKMLGVQYV